jgi:autotransporter-associated beta strand protein
MTSLTKAGNGVLDMRGASTFTSGFNLQAGGLMFGANSTPTSGVVTSGPIGTGSLSIAAGTFLLSDGTARTVANAVTVGGDFTFGGLVAGNSLILSGAVDLGAASRTITVTSPAVTGTLSGPLASTATGTALTKAGPGVLVLSSTTSNLGGAGITVAAGMLRLGATGAIPVSSPITINAGAALDLGGFNFDLTTQALVSSGFITNSASSTSTIHVLGTSVTDVTSTTDASIGLTLVDNFLANTASRLGLTKAGLGTLTFTNTTSLNSGNVLVVAGRVTGSADNTFSPNAAVVLGNATTGALTATLEAGAFNQTIGGLVASNPNASGLASIVVGAGKTLTVNGAVTLGANAAASATNVTFSGGGAMVVNSGGANFQVGGATGDTNGNAANVNLTGLASFTANLGAGTLRVGDGASSTAVPASVLRLAPISTITAATIRVGDASGGDFNHTLFLGSGVNTFRTDTLNIGSAGAGIRSSGTIQFDAADVTGSLSLRGSNGVSPATVNLLNSTGTTGVSMAATADFAGHAADLLIGTMTMAARNNATAAATATFSFDQGVLDITTLTAASRTSTGSGNATATLNLGGGVVDIDSVAMAINTSAGGTVTSTINITGGAVSLGAGTGTAVNMANAGTGRTVTSAINMSGGTLSLAGNIVRTGGAGTENATVTLSGGILDMNGFAFGDATRTIALTAQAGTLRDAGTLNGAGGFTKSGAGTLTLDGAAAYTGVTTVIEGTLVMANTSSAATGVNINGGTNTTVQVTSVASAGTGMFSVSNTAVTVTPMIRFTIDGGGVIALPHSFGGNSGITSTIHVDNNGSGTNGIVQLNGNGGTGWGNATLNVTGGNGYSLYIANLFNFAGALGAMTFNPTTAALELGNLTVGRNTGTGTFILSGTNTESRVSGVISNGSGASLGGLSAVTKTGAGTWTLTGANTYTGATTISAGTLNAAAGSLAATASIAVNGATLSAVNYNAAATLTLNVSGAATISGAGLTITGAVTNANTAANALNFTADSGKVTLASLAGAGATRFGSDADITGGISAGTVTVVGALGASISGGTVSAASLTAASITGGSNSITGAATVTTVNGGTTSIGGVAAITTLTSGTVNLTGSAGTVTNVNGGTLTLAGTALTATNGTGSAALTLDSASSATFTGAGVSLGAVSNANTADDALLFSAAAGTVTLTSLGGAGKSRFASNASIGTLSNGIVTIDGATASIANLNGGSIALGATALTVNSGTFGGVISGATGSLTKSGVGTLILTGVNTFGGGTTISAGTLQLGNGGTSGSIAVGDVANSGTFAISRSDDLTFASKITGTGGFTKLGSGNLTLSGANDYTGATLVSAGTLTAASGALSATSGITVNGALFSAENYNLAATLALDASATATISAADLNISGAVTNAGTAAAALNFTASTGKIILASLAGAGLTRFGSDADITAGVSEGNVTVVGALGANITGGTVTAGSIAGNVSAGTVSAATLTGNVSGGAVTLTGLLTGNVTAGTVSVGSMTGDVGSSVTVSAALNGVITAGTNSIGSLTSASVTGGTNTITGAANVTTINGGTTTVTGVATITTLSSGTLNLNGATSSIGTLTDGTITLGNTTALTAHDGTFAGLLAGGGSLIKASSGMLTINGANTFTGGTTINAGTLTIGNVAALGTGTITVASGGTLNLDGRVVSNAISVLGTGLVTGGPDAATTPIGGTTEITTILTGTGGLEKTDGGALTLSTPNFFTGAVEANVAGAVIKAAFLDDASSSLGASTLTDPANLVLGSGAKLEFTGASSAVTSRSFTIGGSAGISATGTGTLEFTSASQIATTGAEPALTLTANNSGTNRFAASLAAGSTPLANLAVDGTGVWVIGTGANRFKSDVRISAGDNVTIGLEQSSLPSSATLAVGNNATLRWEAGNTTPVNLEVAAGTTAKLDLGANTVVFTSAPVVTGTGSTTLEKQGSGTLRIANGVSAPTVNVTLPANSGLLSVNGTIGNVTLASGSRLGGSGTVTTATLVSGAILAPGNSTATLRATTVVMPGGSILDWQVQNATGNAGTGYDTLVISGSLDLTGANSSNRVILRIGSLLGNGDGNTPGNPLNFGAPNGVGSIRNFQFASVQAGSSGVLLGNGLNISDVFEFNVNGFTYSDGTSSNASLWSIDWNQTNGAITLTAVPEPSTYGFGLGALALAAAAIRRRKRQAKA